MYYAWVNKVRQVIRKRLLRSYCRAPTLQDIKKKTCPPKLLHVITLTVLISRSL